MIALPLISFVAGFAVCWFLARRAIRIAHGEKIGAQRLRAQLIDFCDKNDIVIRPWDVPPFERVRSGEEPHPGC